MEVIYNADTRSFSVGRALAGAGMVAGLAGKLMKKKSSPYSSKVKFNPFVTKGARRQAMERDRMEHELRMAKLQNTQNSAGRRMDIFNRVMDDRKEGRNSKYDLKHAKLNAKVDLTKDKRAHRESILGMAGDQLSDRRKTKAALLKDKRAHRENLAGMVGGQLSDRRRTKADLVKNKRAHRTDRLSNLRSHRENLAAGIGNQLDGVRQSTDKRVAMLHDQFKHRRENRRGIKSDKLDYKRGIRADKLDVKKHRKSENTSRFNKAMNTIRPTR